ncbi:hypothetical protein [Sphingomonas sp. LY160]|uniref:hypothetical protein n=1 Tax=Sphingomonas sp. LY160 TaxID=3095342 RepID=UPI002ADEB2BC|nr:hypothetical protein [Sphingomonas sp. LY160]MEA1072145.1 hypothetical protein [Sphingomonas sp. LY160]
MTVAFPTLPSDPTQRAGLALGAGGLLIVAALLLAQAADPPLRLGGLGDANPAAGLLFVMAGGVLWLSARQPKLRRLVSLFAGLGLLALALPLLVRPFFPEAAG